MDESERQKAGAEFVELDGVVRRLRRECPWDRAQTPLTLGKYLVEETYETLAAIESGDPRAIADELGDLLLQILLQTAIAEESGGIGLTELLRAARGKLIRRHPHVFGDSPAASPEEVATRWEEAKREERRQAGMESALDGIPHCLPALVRAEKLGERARAAGMDWPDLASVLRKVREELDETLVALEKGATDEMAAELGDCLLALANAPRFIGWSAEETLRRACEKFIRRFKMVERRVGESGRELQQMSPAELDRLWEEAKASGGSEKK